MTANKIARFSPPPPPMTKEEAWKWLGISKPTLERMMRRREISFVRIGARSVRFTEKQLIEYVERQEQKACGAEKTDQDRSSTGGFQSEPTARPGAEPGSTSAPARHAESRLASRIFGKRRKN